MTEGPQAAAPAYVVTFDRIGRNHSVEPLQVFGDANEIATQIYRYARPKLGSRDVQVWVELPQLRTGIVVGGLRPAGRGTLTPVEVADEHPA